MAHAVSVLDNEG